MLYFNLLRPAHDIHVSNTQVKISETGTLEIVVRIFYDDLQQAMGLQPGQALPSKYPSADALIEKYLSEKMKWTFDGKKRSPRYIKSKAASPAVWAYLQFEESAQSVKSIRLENKLLLDQFDDQTNMVRVESQGQEYNFIMDKNNWFVDISSEAH